MNAKENEVLKSIIEKLAESVTQQEQTLAIAERLQDFYVALTNRVQRLERMTNAMNEKLNVEY